MPHASDHLGARPGPGPRLGSRGSEDPRAPCPAGRASAAWSQPGGRGRGEKRRRCLCRRCPALPGVRPLAAAVAGLAGPGPAAGFCPRPQEGPQGSLGEGSWHRVQPPDAGPPGLPLGQTSKSCTRRCCLLLPPHSWLTPGPTPRGLGSCMGFWTRSGPWLGPGAGRSPSPLGGTQSLCGGTLLQAWHSPLSTPHRPALRPFFPLCAGRGGLPETRCTAAQALGKPEPLARCPLQSGEPPPSPRAPPAPSRAAWPRAAHTWPGLPGV